MSPAKHERPASGRDVTRHAWRFVVAGFAGFGVLAIIVGFATDVFGLRSLQLNKALPQVELVVYEIVDGRPVLGGSDGTVDYDLGDVELNQVRIPVRIALRNVEDRPLEVVRVELRYPATLEVKSAGDARVDPTGRTIIYEHDLGTLESVDNYTPVEPLDEVVVPYLFTAFSTVSLDRNNVPLYFVTVTGENALGSDSDELNINYKVYIRDRPPLEGIVGLQLAPSRDIVPQGSGRAVKRNPTDTERESFHTPVDVVLDEWTRPVGPEGRMVHYMKCDTADGIVLALEVDSQLRLLIADTDRDRNINYELVDQDGDGIADVHVSYRGGNRFMVDWLDSSFWIPFGSSRD